MEWQPLTSLLLKHLFWGNLALLLCLNRFYCFYDPAKNIKNFTRYYLSYSALEFLTNLSLQQASHYCLQMLGREINHNVNHRHIKRYRSEHCIVNLFRVNYTMLTLKTNKQHSNIWYKYVQTISSNKHPSFHPQIYFCWAKYVHKWAIFTLK